MLLEHIRYKGRSFGLVPPSCCGLALFFENDRLMVSFLTHLTERESVALGRSRYLANLPEYDDAVEPAIMLAKVCSNPEKDDYREKQITPNRKTWAKRSYGKIIVCILFIFQCEIPISS